MSALASSSVFLADINGGVIFMIVMAVITIIQKIAAKNENEPPRPITGPRPSPSPGRPIQAESDEERMRRFLEALGLPAQTPQAPPPLPQQTPKPRQDRPVSQKKSGEITRAKPRAVPPPIPVQEEYSLDSADTTTTPAGQIHFKELEGLRVTETPDFQTVTSRISATDRQLGLPPSQLDPFCAEETPETLPEQNLNPSSARVLALLKSRQDLRAALVAAEILGPPRSFTNE